MNVVVSGQEAEWVNSLSALCEEKNIEIIEKSNMTSNHKIHLLVTDFPIEEVRKGIFAKIPFLVISKCSSEEKELEAFWAGAEDYMVQPVKPDVAAARIDRILWRYYHIDREICEMHRDVHLTPNEQKILTCLLSNPQKVFSRNELIEEVFGDYFDGIDRGIDNYIRQIRAKIEENPKKPEHILTLYGIGYKYMP